MREAISVDCALAMEVSAINANAVMSGLFN